MYYFLYTIKPLAHRQPGTPGIHVIADYSLFFAFRLLCRLFAIHIHITIPMH